MREDSAQRGLECDADISSRIFALQLQPHARAGQVGSHSALTGFAKSVKKHAFDARMIVEELHVNGTGNRAAHMQMHAGSAMG